MCIKLGSNGEVGYRISDDGQFESQEIEEGWVGCNARHVCGQPIRESLGLGGVSVVAYRLRLANNKCIVIRHINGTLEMTEPNRPALLRGGPDALCVIMPVNLQ